MVTRMVRNSARRRGLRPSSAKAVGARKIAGVKTSVVMTFAKTRERQADGVGSQPAAGDGGGQRLEVAGLDGAEAHAAQEGDGVPLQAAAENARSH